MKNIIEEMRVSYNVAITNRKSNTKSQKKFLINFTHSTYVTLYEYLKKNVHEIFIYIFTYYINIYSLIYNSRKTIKQGSLIFENCEHLCASKLFVVRDIFRNK